jgi:hypothetical protein
MRLALGVADVCISERTQRMVSMDEYETVSRLLATAQTKLLRGVKVIKEEGTLSKLIWDVFADLNHEVGRSCFQGEVSLKQQLAESQAKVTELTRSLQFVLSDASSREFKSKVVLSETAPLGQQLVVKGHQSSGIIKTSEVHQIDKSVVLQAHLAHEPSDSTEGISPSEQDLRTLASSYDNVLRDHEQGGQQSKRCDLTRLAQDSSSEVVSQEVLDTAKLTELTENYFTHNPMCFDQEPLETGRKVSSQQLQTVKTTVQGQGLCFAKGEVTCDITSGLRSTSTFRGRDQSLACKVKETAHSKLERVQRTLRDTEEKLNKCEGDLSCVEAQYKGLTEENQTLYLQVSTLENAAKEVWKQMKQFEAAAASLEQDKAQLQAQLTEIQGLQLHYQLGRRRSEAEERQVKEINSEEGKLEQVGAKQDQMQGFYKQLDDELTQALSEKIELERALSDAVMEISGKNAEILSLVGHHTQLQQELKETAALLETARRQLLANLKQKEEQGCPQESEEQTTNHIYVEESSQE